MLALQTKMTVPPGGYKFTDPHSGMKFPLDGGFCISWDSLVREVKHHRMACDGDLEIGWEERLEHEYCCQNPDAQCYHNLPSKDLTITRADVARFGYSVLEFIKGGGQYVSQEEADRRASICLQCPYRLPNTFCPSCQSLISFLSSQAFGDRSTPHDDELGNCGVCKCYNKIAVHWPLEAQSTEGISNEDFPDHCWKKH